MLQEANERLQEDLETREAKVKEMEEAQEERQLLAQKVTADSGTAEEKEALIEEWNGPNPNPNPNPHWG